MDPVEGRGAPAARAPQRKSPLAARIVLDNGSGLDVTEAGTRKSLALYVVRDPADVEGIARLGPDPLDDAFTIEVLARHPASAAGRAQIKGVLRSQGNIAGIGNAYSDELLHAARMSPFKPANSLTDDRAADAVRRDPHGAGRRGRALERTARPASSRVRRSRTMAVHGRTGETCPVCGDVVREVSFADS